MNRKTTLLLRPVPLLLAAVLLVGVGGGCRSGVADDPILRMSAAEALERGKELMAEEKYNKSRRYLSQAFEVEPNSRAGREGLLLLADSYFLAGGEANWIQAEAKYRDFLNRFPTSDQAAYAQYQIARSLGERVEKPNRDQSATLKALDAYRELQRLYPTSEYAAEAEARIREVRNQLAAHEFVIGDFYLSYRYPAAAVSRFVDLLEDFPEYEERDKVLFHLGLAYSRARRPDLRAKAAGTFEQLREEHPDSRWIDEIPEDLPEVPQPEPEEGGTAIAGDEAPEGDGEGDQDETDQGASR